MVRLSRVTSALQCRYGLRVCGLVEYEGPFDMDIAPEGVQAVCHVLCCAVLCCAVLYTHVTTAIGMTGDRTRKLPQGERARYQGRLQSVSSGDTHGL